MSKTQRRIKVRIDKETYENIEAIAKLTGKSIEEVVDDVCERYLEERRTLTSLMT